MKKEKIGNILQMQRGYDLPVSQMRNGQIPVVGSNGVVGYHDTAKCFTPTITIGRSGSAGKIHMYDTPTWVHNTALYLTDFKGNNPKYLYYLLRLLHLETLCGSSVIPSLNRNVVYPMVVNFHENREDQDAISSILSKIDEKIAVNHEINRNLEAMSRQLYDYWFVQFDFPDENGRPYKSSGGKMVWNEKLKRDIPESWQVVNLFHGVDIQYGFPFSTELFIEEPTLVPVVRIRDILNGTTSAYSKEDADEKYRLSKGDVVVGMDGNFHMNIWSDETAYLNQRCVRLRHIEGCPISTLQVLHEIAPYIKAKEQNAKGSTVGHLSDKDLKAIWIVKPLTTTKFNPEITFAKLSEKIVDNRNEIVALTKQRDELLPLLMNGQVSVMPTEVNCDLVA